jgi:hypothetical protein
MSPVLGIDGALSRHTSFNTLVRAYLRHRALVVY